MARVADGVDASRLGEANDDQRLENTEAETSSLTQPVHDGVVSPSLEEPIISSAPSSSSSLSSRVVVSTVGLSRACKMRLEQDRCQAARETGFDAFNLLLRQPQHQVPNKQDILVGVRQSDTVIAEALRQALVKME
jgi:hypothetical protein